MKSEMDLEEDLHSAVRSNQLARIPKILADIADPNADHSYAIGEAVQHGNLAALKLFHKLNVRFTGLEENMLRFGISNRKHRSLVFLLGLSGWSETELSDACRIAINNGNYPAMVRLISAGAKLEEPIDLWSLTQYDSVQCLKYLVNAGFDLPSPVDDLVIQAVGCSPYKIFRFVLNNYSVSVPCVND